MESSSEARSALAVAERASAAPYIDYPPTPAWYAPSVGAWVALLVLAGYGASNRPAIFVPLVLVLVAAECAFLAWYRRYRQTMPSMRGAPPEINAAFRRYAVGLVAVVAIGVFLYLVVSPYVAAAAAFGLVTAGLALYERHYANAAAAARTRLA
ncbi:hypothetical protein OJ997_33245 [Solirubrobacter phytolaccae]|uniref:Uncharacterized protein n=1 Tax=Solirubrobacter phytolaccae TaxID=1404360 RepID=A0A9X3NEV0_9ACTN|nr:hypothetical protein [Solirubrobacter phytolaccae]MDA0185218.1 hypothetical protein [Solirubrobacter phytolaccae]